MYQAKNLWLIIVTISSNSNLFDDSNNLLDQDGDVVEDEDDPWVCDS